MQHALTRKLARRVIALTLLVSPPDSREWAAAMAAELDHVEGSFEALSWSIGCFGTALKQLCISILSPGALAAETEGSMSKLAKISAIVLLIGSSLFLFAPTFQQGVKLTASSWHLSDDAWLSEMRKLGAQAEASHDARALAFVAMQLNDGGESDPRIGAKDHSLRDKFADEAVQWNAGLTWIYYPILSRDWSPEARDPNDARWSARLEAWNPNNAAVYAREASFYLPRGVTGVNPQAGRDLLANSPHWLDVMAKAFSATEYDSYVSRKSELDLKVSESYGIYDPARMLRGIAFYPIFENVNLELYAKNFLLKSGESLKAKGDLRGAKEEYWKVSHLAGLMQLRGDNDTESMIAADMQLAVGPSLEDVFRKSGDTSAASLVAYQTEMAQQAKTRVMTKYSPAKREAEYRPFDAWLVQSSLLGIVLSLLLILCSGIYLTTKRLLHHQSMGGASRLFAKGGRIATVLLFISALVMYFAYSPYATAFHVYLASSTPRDTFEELAKFGLLQSLPTFVFKWFLGRTFRVYFWYTIIAMGGAIIVWILCRQLSRTFHRSAPVQPVA